MYQIREVFQANPGKAKELVKMFKQADPHFENIQGIKRVIVLTGIVSTCWTVVVKMETEDIIGFFSNLRSATMSDELKDIMKGYMNRLEGGKRKIFIIE